MTPGSGAGVELVETAHFRVLGGCVEPKRCLHLDNDLADAIAAELGPLGLVPDQASFERVFTATVEGSAPTPALAWTSFYRNTLAGLRAAAGRRTGIRSGSVAAFGRIYAEVAGCVAGARVLDVGSCFGFLPLLLAERRPDALVCGSDLSANSVALAGRVARNLRSPARFLVADAARLPFPDRSVDTVTAIHLLEHLTRNAGRTVLREALRVAGRRVLVAVPVEDRPDPVFGHVSTFTPTTLAALGAGTGWDIRVWERDGAWLQLDRLGH